MNKHKMPPCFLLSEKSFKKDEKIPLKSLDLDLLKHMQALRLKDGEEMRFLNGLGVWALGQWFSNSHVQIVTVEKQEPWTPAIDLYLSPPKGDDLSTALSQATQMGVRKIYFLSTQHNQHPLKSEPWKRSERIVQASMEQCALAWNPELASSWLSLEKALDGAKNAVFCDESSAHKRGQLGWIKNSPKSKSQEIALFIGPEGGWSDSELALLRQKALALCLGPNILKVPTAIVSAATFLRS
jgi:16S rRNA (uracil1498-N3)-methyltransferase